MKAINVRTINDLMEYIKENVPAEKKFIDDLREAAEWFLACWSAEGWLDNRVKDNAYFVLEGITPLKGNDEQAKEIIAIWFEDYDYSVEEGDENLDEKAYATEMFEEAVKRHFGLD